jgi:hypothetical protein
MFRSSLEDIGIALPDDDPVRIETCRREYIVLSGFK